MEHEDPTPDYNTPLASLMHVPQRRQRIHNIASWTALFAGLFGAAAAGVLLVDEALERLVRSPDSVLHQAVRGSMASARPGGGGVGERAVQAPEQDLEQNPAASSAPSPEVHVAGPFTTHIPVEIARLRELERRLAHVEASTRAAPERWEPIALLRRDIGLLESAYDRIYDQNKWFIGLMFTMALGLVGLAISNILQSRR